MEKLTFVSLPTAVLWVAAIAFVCSVNGAEIGLRRQHPLNQGWRFHFGETRDATLDLFDDGAWERVSIPHTWNALGARTVDDHVVRWTDVLLTPGSTLVEIAARRGHSEVRDTCTWIFASSAEKP